MKLRRIFALTASAVLAAALLAGCDWLAWLEDLEGQGGSSSSSSSSSAVTRPDDHHHDGLLAGCRCRRPGARRGRIESYK